MSKSGFLYEEPNFLLKSESVTAVNYFSIIKAIADGNHKLGNMQIVMDEMAKYFTTGFVAFAYEDICKNILRTCAKTVQFLLCRPV